MKTSFESYEELLDYINSEAEKRVEEWKKDPGKYDDKLLEEKILTILKQYQEERKSISDYTFHVLTGNSLEKVQEKLAELESQGKIRKTTKVQTSLFVLSDD